MKTREAIEEIQVLMADFIDENVFIVIGFDSVTIKALDKTFRLSRSDKIEDIMNYIAVLKDREIV